MPDYVIRDMGRWRSVVALLSKYTAEMFEDAQSALARRDLLTADTTRLLLNPRSTMAPSR